MEIKRTLTLIQNFKPLIFKQNIQTITTLLGSAIYKGKLKPLAEPDFCPP